MQEMNAMSKVVFLGISWSESQERIRLEIDILKRERQGRLSTWEKWSDGEVICYRPSFVYRSRKRGPHLLTLKYLRSEHPELKECADKISWGETTLTVARSFKHVRATWTGYDDHPPHDEQVECEITVEEASKLKSTMKRVRMAQQAFKNAVMAYGSRCELSGERTPSVLDAAHVLSVEHGGSDQPENGLILRADLHRLFDAGLFLIRTDGSISPDSSLSKRYLRLLHGKTIRPETLARIAPYLSKRRLTRLPRIRDARGADEHENVIG